MASHPALRLWPALILGLLLLVSGCSDMGPVPPVASSTAAPTSTVVPPTTESAVLPAPDTATMLRAVDGDTLVVLLGPDGAEARVRVLGVNTPERGKCGFAEATAYVDGELPEGARIELVLDESQGDRDRYERLLRYVRYTPPGLDLTRDLSIGLAAAGWAVHYDQYPVTESPAIEAAEAAARAERVGLWAPVSAGGCAI